MEATGQTDVVLPCPCRGEAGYAEGKRATGDGEPRGLGRCFEGLLQIVSGLLAPRIRMGGAESIPVDGLTFEIEIFRGERREVEPGDLGER